MDIKEAVISGIIQGVTEFLPVSSSGHLSLFQHFTNTAGKDSATFTVILHLGTLIAVFIAFFPIIKRLFRAFIKVLLNLRISRNDEDEKMLLMVFISLLPLVISFFLRDLFEYVASDDDVILEGVCFIITSFLIYKAVKAPKKFKGIDDITFKDALLIGLMQAVSPLPGISRSGSTISAAMLLGYTPEFSLDFSFIIGIPTVAAAIFTELFKIPNQGFSIGAAPMLSGLAASLIVGILSIALLKKLTSGNKLIYFSVYTFLLGTAVTAAGIFETFFK